jgi:hypothetical protein
MKKKINYNAPYHLLLTPSMPNVSEYGGFIPPKRLFPEVDKKSAFYKNCKRQRKLEAKICQDCPFHKGIEEQEKK